jgi:hypothetical protein
MTEWSRLCGFEPALHHRYIIERLEAAARGDIHRLAIFLPPGAAKSTYANKLFIPWYLAQRSNQAVLAVSHSQQKAEAFGRFSRNLAVQHAQTLGYNLRHDSKAAGEWETSTGGLFFCAGVGTKIAGNRADLGLIDDPVGSKQDAESKLVRDTTWDWYNSDFKFRLKPGASVILIQTRWHEDDLAGRILQNEKGWTVVSIPLIAEKNDPLGRVEGEPLWPGYFDQEHVADMMASPDFVPMCQQRPSPESGDYFKAPWIDDATYGADNERPTDLRWYMGSDHALTKKEENDASALVPGGVDENGDLWIPPEIWWDRAVTTDVVNEMFRLNRKFHPVYWWAGKDHIVGSIGPFIDLMQREMREYIPLEPLSESRDKQAKCQPIRAMFKLGRVHLPRFAPWFAAARDELLRFDKGTHDDFVDALEKLGRGLESQIRSRKPKTEVENVTPPAPCLTLSYVKENMRLQRRDREAAHAGM